MTSYDKRIFKLLQIMQESNLILPGKELSTLIHLRMAGAIGFDEGRQQGKHRKEVEQLFNGEVIRRFDSCEDAARKMDVDKTSISKGCLKNKTVCGCKWRYV